ncbi:MAG: hypothetical protein ACMUIU_18665 [bacterium]
MPFFNRRIQFLCVLLAIMAVTGSCSRAGKKHDNFKQPVWAYLIQPDIVLNPGETSKILWLPMPATGAVMFSKSESVNVTVYNQGGKEADTANVKIYKQYHELFDIGAVKFVNPEGIYYIKFSRTEVSTRILKLEAQITFDYPKKVFTQENLLQNIIYSPIISFPGGDPINDRGYGTEAFADYVMQTYNYDMTKGISFLNYMMINELPLVFFPGQAAPSPMPSPTRGPTPPSGAEHDDNYCGLSVFIHSMITTFPGSLPSDVTTNPRSWDKIGDAIDHSNWFGERGAKLVDNVNENFGEIHPQSSNGKRYCAGKLSDTSLANLEAWNEDCNLKMLIYDWPEFGHWVDVTAINGNTLTIQDYSVNATVTYNPSNKSVDFSSAQNTEMATSNFNGNDKVAGDDPFEIVIFTVVCECDISSGKGKLPGQTRSGKTLKP